MLRDKEAEKEVLKNCEITNLVEVAQTMYDICMISRNSDCNKCTECNYFVNKNVLTFLTILLEHNVITNVDALKFQLDYSKDDSIKNTYAL